MKIYRTSLGNFTIFDIIATVGAFAAMVTVASITFFVIHAMVYGLV